MTTTTACPNHVTVIRQDRGLHHTGLRVDELHDVRTEFADYYGALDWESLTEADRAYCAATLAEIHAATVDLESLDAEHRERAKEYLLGEQIDDPDDVPGAIRRAILATAEAPDSR
jgi:hypothetical protein